MKFIIVLGNSVEKVRNLRVDTAINYVNTLEKNIENENYEEYKIIFSGGGKIKSEAQRMYEYANIHYGVAKEKCMLEEKSSNTYENIYNVKCMVEGLGWFSPTNIQNYSFVICTSSFHIQRSYLIAVSVLGNFGNVTNIHTNETPTELQKKNESILIYNYLSWLVDVGSA